MRRTLSLAALLLLAGCATTRPPSDPAWEARQARADSLMLLSRPSETDLAWLRLHQEEAARRQQSAHEERSSVARGTMIGVGTLAVLLGGAVAIIALTDD